MKEIPQLITKKNDVSETVNTDNKDTVKQKEAKFENGVITRKADEKQLIIQMLTRNQVNNLKTTPSNKRNASKASTNKTSGQKSNIIRNHHKVLRNKVVQVSQLKRIIKLVIRIQKQQMLNHQMHQKIKCKS